MLEEGEQRETLVAETFNMALLDSGCTKTVCGKTWLDVYRQSLSDEMKDQAQKLTPSDRSFKFGNDTHVNSLGKVMIPVFISKWIYIESEVISSEVPLLFSRELMKKMDTTIGFKTDSVHMMGEKQKVKKTSNGHLCIPLSRYETHHVYFTSNIEGQSEKTLKQIAVKLHQQFAHASSKRLIRLLKDGGVEDKDFFECVTEVVKTCEICQRFARPPPRPVVGFPRARRFNINIAVDLKQFGSRHMIHFIDHFTKFSVCVIINDKKKETILRAFLECWIAIFGGPEALLSDNGGEFNNDDFKQLCEKFNVEVTATAAESPWSNGVVERHNSTVGAMVSKLVADGHSLDDAARWACSAKNSLSNVEGFSPCQLVFGVNPNLPSVLTSKLPALDDCYGSYGERLRMSLDVMEDARKAYIQAESSVKLKKAVMKQTRTHLPAGIYQLGDKVFFRRDRENVWRGPAKITSIADKDIQVQQGGQQYKVHPCRIKHVQEDAAQTEDSDAKDLSPVIQQVTQRVMPSKDQSPVIPHVMTGMDQSPVIQNSRTYEPSQEVVEEPTQHEESRVSQEAEEEHRPVLLDNESLPMPQSYVAIKTAEDSEWLKYRIMGKGWSNKSKQSKNMFWYNVVKDGENHGSSIYWQDVYRWKTIPEDVLISFVENDQASKEAQLAELTRWKDYKVFEEVPNLNQKTISCQWVMTQKYVNDKRVIKARLVARGFLEKDNMRKDSPTATPESLRLMLSVTMSKGWRLNSLDFKSAFLQGDEIKREVYLKPPREAETQSVWRLKKCVYGLKDASRLWWLRLDAALIDLGLTRLSLDQAVYVWRVNGTLRGILVLHVDDLAWSGERSFLEKVITPLKKKFAISSESSSTFRYLGLQIVQGDRKITVDQSHYIKSIEDVNIDVASRPGTEPLTESEKQEFRSAIGKLVWASTRTRPDMAYEASTASIGMEKATVADVYTLCKHMRKLKNNGLKISFVPLAP